MLAQFSNEFILSLITTLVFVVGWFTRLEAKNNTHGSKIEELEESMGCKINENHKQALERINDVSMQSMGRFGENVKSLERADSRIDRVELRAEQTAGEVRTMLMAIQSSLSNLEGRLSLSVKRDSDRER